jgi:hypothetical protein
MSRVKGLRWQLPLLACIFSIGFAAPAWADQQWLAGQTASAAGFGASGPQVGVDQSGNAISTWTQNDGSNDRILAAYRTSGLTTFFAGIQTISAAGQNASEPQVAVDANGDAVAVWSRFDGTRLRIQAAYRPAGATSSFGSVQDVSDTIGEAFAPQVGISADGEAIAIWVRFDGANYRAQVAIRPSGSASTFGSPQTLSASGQSASEPAIGVAPDGNAVAAWYRSNGTRLRIETAARAPAGSFGAVQTVSPSTEDSFTPQVAVIGGGTATAVWYGSDGVAKLRVESASRPSGGSFGSVQTLSDTAQDAFAPQVSMDPSGNAVAVWDRFDGSKNRIQAAAKPAAGTFGTAQTLSDAGQEASEPQVDLDPNGNAAAIWSRFDGTKTRTQTSVRPAGGTFGTAQTINPATDAFGPQIDQSAGNAVAVWYRGDLRIQANFREPADAPRAAQRLYTSLVPTFRQTISASQCTARGGAPSTHGAPLSLTSCNPPAFQAGTQAFFGPKSRGYVQFVQAGGDVAVVTSLTDVQNAADADYDPNSGGPDITVLSKLRISDHFSTVTGRGCSPNCHATVQEIDWGVPVNCTASPDPATGSNCSAFTSFDAITPGAFAAGREANVSIFRVRVNDSGANGVRADADDRNFAQSGYYVR